MGRPRKDVQAQEMYALYQEGLSLAQVGAAWNVTRQTVYDKFQRRGWPTRAKTFLPTVTFRGETYAPDPDGYFRKTRGDRKWLHHAVWESEHGPIPAGYHIHHVDHDQANNAPSNLVALSPSEHSKHHNPMQLIVLKPCRWCGRPLVRKRHPGGQLEGPAQLALRQYCGAECHANHRRGKPRGWSARREGPPESR